MLGSAQLVASAAVLLLLAAPVIGRFRRPDVAMYGFPLAQLSTAPSRISCAAACHRRPDCSGFTLPNSRNCRLFSLLCPTPSDGLEVRYVQPVTACPSGWHLFRRSCYLRQPAPPEQLDWEQCRAVCRALSPCSDLTSTTDREEAAWILHHRSRPAIGEYVGARTVNGRYVDIDGTEPAYRPPLAYGGELSNGCINLRKQYIMDTWVQRVCTDTREAFICESPFRCHAGGPCPDSWLALDDYCYLYVSVKTSWQDADDQCSGLQAGARLSPIVDMNTWYILNETLAFTSPTHVGMKRESGVFRAVDDTPWNVVWLSQDAGNDTWRKDCAEMESRGANTIPCHVANRFLCRVPVTLC